jgi:hypothetical protein
MMTLMLDAGSEGLIVMEILGAYADNYGNID